MIYGIDWDKYLSNGRYRTSTIQRKPEDIDKRTDFDSDFGRVVFSAPLRRMHDKTQVIPLTSGDKIHTRLTHSLEVMNTAKSLAINLCRDKDFVKEYKPSVAFELEQKITSILMTAGLVHDIGNPPFGHFGETVIQNYFKNNSDNGLLDSDENLDFTEFDGNAQGLRILTHLSYKGDLAGLNLTFATLGSYLKYPNVGKIDKQYIGTKKHGVYSSEKEIFHKIVEECHLKREDGRIKRHPLSFLVEAADSICYLVMDIEDGYSLRWYDKITLIDFLDKKITDQIREFDEKNKNDLLKKKYENYYDRDKKCFSFYRIVKRNPKAELIPPGINDNDWILRFRIDTLQYLVELANSNFKKNAQAIDNGEYSKELIEDDDAFVAKSLFEFSKRYILSQKDIQKVELTGHTVIKGLLDNLICYVKHDDFSFRQKVKQIIAKSALKTAIHEKKENIETPYMPFSPDDIYQFDIAQLSPYAKLRVIVDFISGMTDKFAVSLYQELIGIKI